MWECPTFVPLGDRHVLIVSAHDHAPCYPVYFAGAYSGHRLLPETTGRVDLGSSLYAPQAMVDERGRCLLWGWLREERAQGSCLEDGWAGVLSLPRVLSLAPDGRLLSQPAPELQQLRTSHAALTDVALEPHRPLELADAGETIEIMAVIEPRGAREIELAVFRPRGGEEETRLTFNVAAACLILDTTRSSLSPAGRITRGRVAPETDGPLRLHLFLDRSVLEVFAYGVAASARVYPNLGGTGVALRARGGQAHLHSLDIWQMESIWT
jgi:beta-fructofuranosidase